MLEVGLELELDESVNSSTKEHFKKGSYAQRWSGGQSKGI